jgi:hypothetical protein
MPTDPLALERFRTILADAIRAGSDGVGSHGEWHFPEPDDLAAAMLPDLLGSARFQLALNEHGVKVRRLVIYGEWEVNPAPPSETEKIAQRFLRESDSGAPDPKCIPVPDPVTGEPLHAYECQGHHASDDAPLPRPALCPGTARNGAPCHAEPGHKGGHRASFPA